jgi:oxaloacetate decarboxylase alpha subunit
VLFGRYEKLTAETADLVTGRYGALAAPANPDLVKKALAQNKYDAVLTARPADTIPNEFAKIETEAKAVGAVSVEDVLTYAMFPKVAPNFFRDRAKGPVDSASFVVKPAAPAALVASAPSAPKPASTEPAKYVVNVNGADYNVVVKPTTGAFTVSAAAPVAAPAPVAAAPAAPAAAAPSGGGTVIPAPVAGTVLKHQVDEGTQVVSGDTIIIIESMKMELEIKSTAAGKAHFLVPTGTQVAAQQAIAEIN